MSLSANYEAPAFPQTVDDMGTLRSANAGLTKREYFAGQALMGHCANADLTELDAVRTAQWSVQAADALLSELNKPPTT